MMPDAQGNFKGISVPELPWKDEPVIVHTSAAPGGVDGKGRHYAPSPPRYYWSCRCGQASKLYRQERLAEIAARDHERGCAGAS